MAFYPRVGCPPKRKPPLPRKPDVITAYGPMRTSLRGEAVELWLVVNETIGAYEFAEADGTECTNDVLLRDRAGSPTVETLVSQLSPEQYADMQRAMKVAQDARFRNFENQTKRRRT